MASFWSARALLMAFLQIIQIIHAIYQQQFVTLSDGLTQDKLVYSKCG